MSHELNKVSSENIKDGTVKDTALKKRLLQLMSEEEKKTPFSFATRVGLSKSTFHSIWTKASESIHRSTARKIANATGVSVDWLHKGLGEPTDKPVDEDVSSLSGPVLNINDVDRDIMVRSIMIVNDYVDENKREMNSCDIANLIFNIYELLYKRLERNEGDSNLAVDITTILENSV